MLILDCWPKCPLHTHTHTHAQKLLSHVDLPAAHSPHDFWILLYLTTRLHTGMHEHPHTLINLYRGWQRSCLAFSFFLTAALFFNNSPHLNRSTLILSASGRAAKRKKSVLSPPSLPSSSPRLSFSPVSQFFRRRLCISTRVGLHSLTMTSGGAYTYTLLYVHFKGSSGTVLGNPDLTLTQ